MIDKAGLDAIVIATPDSTHHDICLAAAHAGLHIVCEKPLAMNLAEAERMLAAVENAGTKHLAYFTWRWVPWLRYAKQLVDEGYLGEICESRFSLTGGFGRSAERHWKWDRRSGLGVLGDLGSHMIDLAHWLVGPIVDVDASLMNFVDRSGSGEDPIDPSNDSALLSVRYHNGSHGLIEASAVTHLGERGMAWDVHLRGTRGTIQVTADLANGWRMWGIKDDEEGGPLEIPAPLMAGIGRDANFGQQVAQIFTKHSVGMRLFVDAIIEDLEVESSFAHGYRVQQILETALMSSRERKRLQVADVSGPSLH